MKPDYCKYRAFSELVASILRKIDLKTECVGLDEYNLDCTDYAARNNIKDLDEVAK